MSVVENEVTGPGPSEVPPPSPTKPCEVCGLPIPATAIKCKECKSAQRGKDCVHCGASIPGKATVCSECDGYQDWRRRVPVSQMTLALLVAVFSVIGASFPYAVKFINLRSQTSGFFLETAIDKTLTNSDERSVITARLTNDGGRASEAKGARIDFGLAALPPATLEIMNRNSSVVPAGGTSDIRLFVYGLKTKQPPGANVTEQQSNAARADLALALCSAKVTLFVSVRERSRLGRLESPKDLEPIDIPTATAREWVLERILGVPDPEKEKCP